MKKQYIAPRITVLPIETEGLLETISLPIGPGPAPGPSEGKESDFFDEDNEQHMAGYELWQE